MFFRENGELNDALVSYPDGSMAIYNDGELLQLISASGDTTDYQDGKIRKITLNDSTVYDWSYDANGNIIILDNAKSEKRTYHEGKLTELEELTGSKLVTRYYYDAASGDLNKSEVCQNGEVLYTYTYTYENDLTIIHDVDGNTQAYNKDKKLTYIIDSTGKEYSYTYVGRSEGYIEVYFPSGVKVRYDSDSKIVDVAKADGAVISNITFDTNNNPVDFTYVKDEVTYKVVGGNISEAASKDGTILYYDNGFIKSIQSSLEEYQYYIVDSKVYKDASFFQAGSKLNNVSYYLNNDVTTLALSPDSLLFGTGADGAKHVKTDEVLEAGTYNFTSLVIDAGKTLTVSSGATLKCLDTLDVKGKLLGSNIYIGASIITVEAGGSIVGLNQVIRANTVNNSGLIGDVCMAPDAAFNLSGYTGSYSGPAQNAYDGNLDTSSGYYYRERGGNGYFSDGAYTTWAWTFDTPQDISTLAWKLKSAAQVWSGASENSGAWGVYIAVTHDGGTSVLVNESQNVPANGTLYGYSQNDKLVENATGWTGVTKIEVKLYGKAKRKDEGAGGGNEDIYHYLYEMKADGANISYLASSGDAPVSMPYVYPSSGTFESDVMEINSLTLDSMSWNENLPAGTAISIQTRTGNTLDPDAGDSGWTGWSTTPMTNSGGSPMTTAQAKYIQYKITMTTSNYNLTPSLNLSAGSPLAVGFKRAPTDVSELESISFMTRKKDGITYGYNTNGLLIWMESASGIHTDYDPPDTANKIDPSKLIFDYTYTDDIKSLLPTLILNDTQKMIYMKDNIIVSELTAVNNPDGSRSEYVQGKLSKIKMADGVEITNISFDDNNKAKDFTYIKDSTTYIVRDKNISEAITSTGVHTKYYPYGMEKSIEDATSKIEYDYGIASGSTYTTNSAFQTGDFDDTSFYNNGNTAYLELSSDSLKYGTGIDGVKHVTANETLATGTHNFTSLVIDAGATLTVASGATIKVLDTLDVKGKLSGSNINLSAYTITVAQGGAVVGLDQTIQANTVNNTGIIGDVCMASDTTFNLSGYTGSYSGPAQNAYDGNLDTSSGYYYRERGGNGYFYNGAYTTWTWTFSNPQDISKLAWKLKSAAQVWSGASENSGAWGVKITVTHDGETSVLVDESQNVPANGNLYGYSQNNQVVENNHGWTGVTQIQVKLYGKAKRKDEGAGGGNEDIYHYLYEMKADGVDLAYVSSTGDVPAPTMSSTHPLSGTFESDVVEVNALTFDKILWSQELPTGTGVTIQTRTGNTETPDDSWSEWSNPVSDPSGSKIASPNGKYFQYRVNLTSNDANVSPKLIVDANHAISLSYTKFSDSLTDPYVKVKENNVTKAYNKEGVIIWEEDILGNRTTYDPANPYETIDVAPLKFDSTYADAQKKGLPTSKLGDAQKVITIYDKGNDTPVEIVSADQSITYFDEGFATKVVDKNGIVQVQYTYDNDHNIQKVDFVDARQKLEENYQRAIAEISTQKEAALAKLDAAEVSSRADIEKKAADAQKQIDDERKRLTNEKAQYDPNVYDLSEFDKVFTQLDDYQDQLDQQIIDAYVDLDRQVTSARARINADASTAMHDLINNDYNKILADICQKESSPILYQYYRKILGRDPGDSELIYWTDKAKADLIPINPTEITQYLQNMAEYADREARKQNIISSLATFFSEYLTASETEKEAMIVSLGLTSSEIVDLAQADVDAITSYLNGQSLHFGDSAFTTIVEMLKAQGTNKSFEDVGKEAIKIDILTGVITKDAKGDLIISMYAMRKAAEHYGLTLYSEKISYDDLKDQVSRGNVIVHIDGKHYVLVTAIDDVKGTITYTDLTVGENGQSMTLSRAEFMAKWKGYSMAKELPAGQAKQLNVTQEKNIRGSGWWEDFWRGIVNFFQKIIAPVSTVLMMLWVVNPVFGGIGAVLAALNVVVQTVSFVVKTGTLMDVAWAAINAIGSAIGSVVLPNIYEAAGKFFSSVGSQIFAPIQGAFQSVMGTFETITAAVKGIATGIGQIVTLGLTDVQIATSIGYNIISQGISLGTNYLFQSMHLDPALTNIGSALLTGAIMGAVTTNTNIVAEALRYGTIAGVEELGRAADLDPNVTHLSAMIAGSLVGGALDIGEHHLTYEKLMESIAPKILSESAYIGVTEIGDLVGIDPRISYLAGVGIRSTINAGLTHEFKPDVIWGEVTQGLLQGVTNIGLNYLTQEMGVNPLLANIGFSAISTALQAGIQSLMPQREKDVFKAMFETYESNVLTFLGSGTSSDAWQQAAYISQILDFSNIVQERGLTDALNTYGAGFFNAVAVNAIVKTGYTLGGYFAEKLQTGQYRLDIVNGEEVAVVDTPTQSDGGHSSGFFKWILDEGGVDGYWNPLGMGKTTSSGDDFWGIGKLGTDAYGRLGFYDNTSIYQDFGDLGIWQTINDGYQSYAEIKDNAGKTIFVVTPKEDGGYNYYNSYGDYVDAVLKEFDRGYTINFAEGDISTLYLEATVPVSEEMRQLLATFGINDVDELGTLYYYLSDEDNKASLISYYFNDEIRELINNNPYLIGDIIDLATIAGGSKADLINALFEGINYENLTEGTVSRTSQTSVETIINQVENIYLNPLSDTTAILIPGTDIDQILEDIKINNGYVGRDPNWADSTSVKYYLSELGADVQSYNWSGNTAKDMDSTAIGLAAYVKNLRQQYPDRKITLIGHSAGDLIVEKTLNILKADNIYVDTYIGLGSPSGNANRVHTNLGEWYNISSSKDIISLPSTSLKNTNQIRYNDLTHLDYFGVYDGQVVDIGAFDRIMRILLRAEIEEILGTQ
ncbi:MAG: cysteine peptidase family C39 domain-containing protein [Candidatus Omnitrophota bacterium]